jgi:hypothetical protein
MSDDPPRLWTAGPPARWLRPAVAAVYVGKPANQLLALARAGKLPMPTYHFGPKSPRYDREAIDALILGRQAQDTHGAIMARALQRRAADREERERWRTVPTPGSLAASTLHNALWVQPGSQCPGCQPP